MEGLDLTTLLVKYFSVQLAIVVFGVVALIKNLLPAEIETKWMVVGAIVSSVVVGMLCMKLDIVICVSTGLLVPGLVAGIDDRLKKINTGSTEVK